MTKNRIMDRNLRICYFNASPNIIDASLMHLEKRLKLLGEIEIYTLKRMDDPELNPCDLLIIAAQQIPDEEFSRWLAGIGNKMHRQGNIWVPALIVADITFSILQQVLEQAVKMNWYFDIINEKHFDSLPIRVANLLRIHDHLHELKRYEMTLDGLSKKADSLSSEFAKLKK